MKLLFTSLFFFWLRRLLIDVDLKTIIDLRAFHTPKSSSMSSTSALSSTMFTNTVKFIRRIIIIVQKTVYCKWLRQTRLEIHRVLHVFGYCPCWLREDNEKRLDLWCIASEFWQNRQLMHDCFAYCSFVMNYKHNIKELLEWSDTLTPEEGTFTLFKLYKHRTIFTSHLPVCSWINPYWKMYRTLHFRPFLLLWPWPWPNNLHIRTWVVLSGDIPDVWKWTS